MEAQTSKLYFEVVGKVKQNDKWKKRKMLVIATGAEDSLAIGCDLLRQEGYTDFIVDETKPKKVHKHIASANFADLCFLVTIEVETDEKPMKETLIIYAQDDKLARIKLEEYNKKNLDLSYRLKSLKEVSYFINNLT
jgi:hypothetical protein